MDLKDRQYVIKKMIDRTFRDLDLADDIVIRWRPLQGKRSIVIDPHSGDRRITRNRAEYHAFRSSNLIGLFLSEGLYKAPVAKQLERLLALWPTIVSVCDTVHGGAMFELPLRSTRLRQLKFQGAVPL